MEWNKGYGTDNGEHIHEIMQTSDGGYIGIGQTDEPKEKGFDLLVVKTDAKGNLETLLAMLRQCLNKGKALL